MGSEQNPVENLQQEATCSICLECFTDPVSFDCGHSFCRACIARCSGRSKKNVSCPQCRTPSRKRNFRPNRELRNVVEIAKQLKLATAEGGCERHREPLQFFCEEDQTPLCPECVIAENHRAHKVLPIGQATRDYKEQLEVRLQILKGEKEKLWGWKLSVEERRGQLLENLDTQRQKIVSEFELLRQFLEEQERLLLARLGELRQEIEKEQKERVTKLSEEISRLSDLIIDMEEKSQKPANEFLQNIRSSLSRWEKKPFQPPAEISSELEMRLGAFSQKYFSLRENLVKFKDALPSELEKAEAVSLAKDVEGKCRESSHRLREDMTETEIPQKVNVTLDPDTAHPRLLLSRDRKSVRWGEAQQELPNNPARFHSVPCVLGLEGFTSGRHYWEVEVENSGWWAVGVARESVSRKGLITFNPEQGVWAVQKCEGQYWALTSPVKPLALNTCPKRIWVYLDHTGGQVGFSDADTGIPIFIFPTATFTGERIRPWFQVLLGSQLRL
uniref:Zinc finger protein RFP-like n=1 Tax=Sphenodon punctatus TaxID=8508 RepID=A0A8D0GAT2_SPHPU